MKCIRECVISTNTFAGLLGDCLAARCPDAYNAFISCADPIMETDVCDETLKTQCGLDRP